MTMIRYLYVFLCIRTDIMISIIKKNQKQKQGMLTSIVLIIVNHSFLITHSSEIFDRTRSRTALFDQGHHFVPFYHCRSLAVVAVWNRVYRVILILILYFKDLCIHFSPKTSLIMSKNHNNNYRWLRATSIILVHYSSIATVFNPHSANLL